jgi:hypothetical protein
VGAKQNAARAATPSQLEIPAQEPVQQAFAWEPAEGAGAVESPARRLQLELERSLAPERGAKWSTRRSLAFILATNAGLWIALIAGARALLAH